MNADKRIAKIRARAEKATAGPWLFDSYSTVFSDNEERCSQPDVTNNGEEPPGELWYEVCDVEILSGDTATKEGAFNAEFISHSRDDIPFLLSLVEFQANELDASSETIRGAPWYKDIEILQKQLKESQLECEKLKDERTGSAISYLYTPLSVFGGKTALQVLQTDKEMGEEWVAGVIRRMGYGNPLEPELYRYKAALEWMSAKRAMTIFISEPEHVDDFFAILDTALVPEVKDE